MTIHEGGAHPSARRFDEFARRRRVLRGLLAVLAAYSMGIGGYAVLTPHAFYSNVVGVDLLGPYNQHLTSDVGGLYLGFALLFAWATVTLGRELSRATAAAFTLTQTLHLGYHLAHLGPFTVAQASEEIAGLFPLLALPIAVLLTIALTDSPPDEGGRRRVSGAGGREVVPLS